jgi:hypothetical protein
MENKRISDLDVIFDESFIVYENIVPEEREKACFVDIQIISEEKAVVLNMFPPSFLTVCLKSGDVLSRVDAPGFTYTLNHPPNYDPVAFPYLFC